jgi:hypothetical protein
MSSVVQLEHYFSVDLKSKQFLGKIMVSDEARERVLFEGSLGETVELGLLEGDVLEIKGKNGVLRVSVSAVQLEQMLIEEAQGRRGKQL